MRKIGLFVCNLLENGLWLPALPIVALIGLFSISEFVLWEVL